MIVPREDCGHGRKAERPQTSASGGEDDEWSERKTDSITTNYHNQPSLPTTTNHYQSLQTKVNIIIIFAIIPLLLSQWQREQMSTLEKANIELCPKYSTFASQYNFREVKLYPFQLHILFWTI